MGDSLAEAMEYFEKKGKIDMQLGIKSTLAGGGPSVRGFVRICQKTCFVSVRHFLLGPGKQCGVGRIVFFEYGSDPRLIMTRGILSVSYMLQQNEIILGYEAHVSKSTKTIRNQTF